MKTLAEYQTSQSFGLLLKGAPKSGKSIIALNFPNPYVADIDNNLAGPIRFLRATNKQFDCRYDTIGVGPKGEIIPYEKRWEQLVLCCKAAAQDPWVKTIIIDSGTTMSDILCAHIIAEKDDDKDKGRMTISDWVPFRNMLIKFITTFRGVGKHFIMTCHEITEKDEGTGQLHFKPSIPSKLQDNFGAFFSDEWLVVAEERQGELVRYVKTTPEPRRPMGTSLFGLPGQFKFEWEKFVKYLQ